MYDNKDPSGVHQSIRLRVKTRSNPDNHIRSIYDLALIILDECFDTFFSRAKTADKRPQVMDVFAESIGRVVRPPRICAFFLVPGSMRTLTFFQTNKQAIAFKHLWQLSERLTSIYQSGIEDKVDPALILALLNVTPEAELQREIRDIIDELDIILHISKQQNDMITRFVKLASQIIDADVNKYDYLIKHSNHQETTLEATLKRLAQQQSAFKTHSDDLLSEIQDRIDELSGLKTSAESTAQNVSLPVDPVRYSRTNNFSGQRSFEPQTAASQCRPGLRGHEARRRDGASRQGNHGFHRDDDHFCESPGNSDCFCAN